MRPLNVRIGQISLQHVRQYAKGKHGGGGTDYVDFEIKIGQRGGQKNKARNTIKEMQHCIAVTDALKEAQPLAQERIVDSKNLRHAPCPADALADMAREAFCGQSCCQWNINIGGGIAKPMKFQGRWLLGHK